MLRGSERTCDDHALRLLATKVDIVGNKWICSNLLYHRMAALYNTERASISERRFYISWERSHLSEANQAV